MTPRLRICYRPYLLLCLRGLTSFAIAAPPDHWVGTWGASPVLTPNTNGRIVSGDTTLREIVHVSLGGPTARVVLSNEFGLDPLTIGAAASRSAQATAAIIRLLVEPRSPSAASPPSIIPAGALVVSDPSRDEASRRSPTSPSASSFRIRPSSTLRSTALPTRPTTQLPATSSARRRWTRPQTYPSWPFLKGIDVKGRADSGAIVPSATASPTARCSTRNTNARWPDVLARRLQADKKTANLGVINEGIGGNRVLHDVTGPSALARFDRDVLAQAGVKYLIILESINDIGHAYDPDPAKRYDVVTADDLIFGLGQLAERAHTHGIKVYRRDAHSLRRRQVRLTRRRSVREAVNNWIRTTKQLDGFIDFDKATAGPCQSHASTCPRTTPATTSTPRTPATRRWAIPSISSSSNEISLRTYPRRRRNGRSIAPAVSILCIRRKLLQFDPGKEVADLKRRRILSIRAVDRILSNRRRELLANRSLFSLRRVGRTHQLAEIGDGIFLLQDHREDRPGAHELGQLPEERTRRMDVIEALGLRFGDGHPLDGDNLKSCLFNHGEDGGRRALADRVRLDDAECTL